LVDAVDVAVTTSAAVRRTSPVTEELTTDILTSLSPGGEIWCCLLVYPRDALHHNQSQ